MWCSRSARRSTACAMRTGRLSDERLAELAADPQVKMFEIKLSQGAKPGKGGVLPGAKVTRRDRAIRGIPAVEAR